jgi:hypothetical protein
MLFCFSCRSIVHSHVCLFACFFVLFGLIVCFSVCLYFIVFLFVCLSVCPFVCLFFVVVQSTYAHARFSALL